MSRDTLLYFLRNLPPDAEADFERVIEADSEVGAAARTVFRALQEALRHHDHPETTHHYPDFFELVKAASDETPGNQILRVCRAYLDAGKSIPEGLLPPLLSYLGEHVGTKRDVRHLMELKGLGGVVPNYESPTEMWSAILNNTLQKKLSGSSQPTVPEGRATSSEILSASPGPTFQKILKQALNEFKFNENLRGFIRSIEQGQAPKASELIDCMTGLFDHNASKLFLQRVEGININIADLPENKTLREYWTEVWNLCARIDRSAISKPGEQQSPSNIQGKDAVKDEKIAALETENATLKSDNDALRKRLVGLLSHQQQLSDRERNLIERERRLAEGERGLRQQETDLRRREASLNTTSAPSFHQPKSGPEINESEKSILNVWLTQNRDIGRSQLPRQFPMEVIQILAKHFPDRNSIRALFSTTNDNDTLAIKNASSPLDMWTDIYSSYKIGGNVNFVSLIQAVLKEPLSNDAITTSPSPSNYSRDIETLEKGLESDANDPPTPQTLEIVAKHFGTREQMIKLVSYSGLLGPGKVPNEPDPRHMVTSIRRILRGSGKNWHDFLHYAIQYLEAQSRQR